MISGRGGNAITLASRVRPGVVVFQDLQGGLVLLNLKTGVYFGVDPVGTRIWHLIREHGSLREVLQALLSEYEVGGAECTRDLSSSSWVCSMRKSSLKFVLERLRRLSRLSPGERALLLRAWVLFLLFELGLLLLPFKSLLTLCQRPPRRRPQGSVPLARVVWLVEVAGRYAPLGATCLKKSLVLARILAGEGIPTTLRIGVARQGEGLRAHAWLERDGEVLLGIGEEAHRPLYPPG